LGIEIVAQGNNKLHYHLDGINIAAITKKYQFEGNSISASELRYLFRKRYHNALPFNVIFYKNNSEVSAPWIDSETAALWEDYRPKSMLSINCQR
jgi:insecticidal toxin complex protein TccC